MPNNDLKTQSESLFERFLSDHKVPFEPIPVAESPRPDYSVGTVTSWGPILFEVKEIAEDSDFKRGPFGISKRKAGAHIRSKIDQSKKQMHYGYNQNYPSILLLYNILDTVSHMFGTDYHDFYAAMHGDWTLTLGTETGNIIDAGHGRNRSFREGYNTSFTTLAHLAPNTQTGHMRVRLFLNEYAAAPLPVDLPSCFEIVP